ncbi:MAG: Cro/Cl family transcriptional regulator [Gallionella sp.]|nr:MAG: Cro/Cl family transcriptional regulator [Gallionella sp.]
MQKLLDYLNSLPKERQDQFAAACGTTVGYLRKAVCIKQPIGDAIVIAIERETDGLVTVEELRPDRIDNWTYIRGTAKNLTGNTCALNDQPEDKAA